MTPVKSPTGLPDSLKRAARRIGLHDDDLLMARHEKEKLPELGRSYDIYYLRQALGICPNCITRSIYGVNAGPSGVVYRRSRTSLTMRCDFCGLQWTMTWLKVLQAMRHRIASEGEGELGTIVAEIAQKHIGGPSDGS
jgi:hypothetical protein